MFDFPQQAPFTDSIKFPLWNLNINNLMLINFHMSLITKWFFWSFDRHSNKTIALSELLPNINKLRNKILDFFRKFHECSFQIVLVIVIHVLYPIIFFKICPPVSSSRSSSSTDHRTEFTFLYSVHPGYRY